MAFNVSIDQARHEFPEYEFLSALTPSEQKAAFHVRDKRGTDLCLKIIAPDYGLDRLNREVLALQTVNHPNVAKLREYEFSSRQGVQRHFMVEEFVVGKDLEDVLATGVPWVPEHAAGFFAALCDGLTALEKAGIVHRDLKPTNIRVRPDGSPVIIDLGCARHLNRTDLTRTSQGAAIGTPLYFAPEQFRGTKHDIDGRTDLFAVGVLLYRSLTGVHPFMVENMPYAQLEEAVCTSQEYQGSERLAGLPSRWLLLVRRLLEKERGRRPQSAAQVAALLRKLGAA